MEDYTYKLRIDFETEDKITKTFLTSLDKEIRHSVQEVLYNNNLFCTLEFSGFTNNNKNNKLE